MNTPGPLSVSRGENFRITDLHVGEGGPKEKFARNVEAIELLFDLEREQRPPTREEQEVLSRYVGWGGLAQAFDAQQPGWAEKYQRLKALLPQAEYEAARASTLNVHYTSPTVIQAMYEAVGRMGFQGGNILEPSMGVGNFCGMLPQTMQGSRLYGVELDSISGRMAQQLYPQAHITVAGFETTDQRNFYDLAIGNVPFGNYKVRDKGYDRLNFTIHNYFLAKALDQVRPGGIVAFVTSRYTMDAKDPTVRRYLAQRGELRGAIRLPNDAFRANAGTDVVSDILFFQKREHPVDVVPSWVELGQTSEGMVLNRYFVDHPHMVLGEVTAQSTQYSREDYTVVSRPGTTLSDLLSQAIQHIHGTYQPVQVEERESQEESTDTISADPSVSNYSYAIVDGQVYMRENSVMQRVEVSQGVKERIQGMVQLRDLVRQLMDDQLEDREDEVIQARQRELEDVYDRFTQKYGLLNARANAKAFSQDASYYLLCSLENLDENGQLKSKADMFYQRTIRPHRTVTRVETPSEALAVCMGERGKVDLPYMAQLLGRGDTQSVAQELQGVIFAVPGQQEEDGSPHYVTADEYLSGNVWEKLRQAERAAQERGEYQVNVEALRQAQPKDLTASEIDVRLGATWLDKKYIQQFMEHTFEPPSYVRNLIQVDFSPYTAEWQISGKNAVGYNDVAAFMTYGTRRAAEVHTGAVDPGVDNMLRITSDGRKLGLDQRLMNPLLPDDPASKLNACVGNVLRIWEEGKEKRWTQLLFCNLSTPKGMAASTSMTTSRGSWWRPECRRRRWLSSMMPTPR